MRNRRYAVRSNDDNDNEHNNKYNKYDNDDLRTGS
jgi:hypothetical protein